MEEKFYCQVGKMFHFLKIDSKGNWSTWNIDSTDSERLWNSTKDFNGATEKKVDSYDECNKFFTEQILKYQKK